MAMPICLNKRSDKYKNLRVQDWQKAFVLVHTYAWASLEKNVNKPLSTIPYTLILLDKYVNIHVFASINVVLPQNIILRIPAGINNNFHRMWHAKYCPRMQIGAI